MSHQSPITQQMTHQMAPQHVPMPAGVPHGRFPMAPTMTQTPPPPTASQLTYSEKVELIFPVIFATGKNY